MKYGADEFESVWEFLSSVFQDVDYHKLASFNDVNQLRQIIADNTCRYFENLEA